VNRVFVSFPITDFKKIKQQVLHWSSRYDTCCFLDNNEYAGTLNSFECVAAAGQYASISAGAGIAFEQLKLFSREQDDWLFGHFSFELKKETHGLQSAHPDPIGFPDLFFFVPETLLLLNSRRISIGLLSQDHDRVHREILDTVPATGPVGEKQTRILRRFSREEYIRVVQELQAHILRGDCYEINFCQEFYAEDSPVDPLYLFERLNQVSPAPFASFYKTGSRYLLCSSPERYLKKENHRLLSQPMKGTGPRDLSSRSRDEAQKQHLFQSEKDRTENVMVVDLVRNDLSKVAEKDSVRVEELYGVYSYAQVHQMVSTVSAGIRSGLDWTDLVAATFPMGSMTGAPKKRVLELIEQYEKSRRGLFSGALGYVTPARDFDFNVVIRSILYNQDRRYLSYFAGSGITFNSDAALEYEECLLKARAMEQVIKTP
jgi:para-aminobenzoate synthetase component I